jgi:hypothetical protein
MNDKPRTCAGCEVGMKRRLDGVHVDKDGHLFMTCEDEKERRIEARWSEIRDEWLKRIPIT